MHRIYVTDAKGIVLLDSGAKRWSPGLFQMERRVPDLRGGGARSTRSAADDPARR